MSHEEVECKRQGDLKVMAWCGMVDGRMLAVGWMVDENGRSLSVTSSGDGATACLARSLEPIQALKLLVHARRSNISHDRPQHQLSHQKDLWKGHLPSIALGAQLATIHFGSLSS